MRTVLALIAAAAMIVGALYVRGDLGGGGGGLARGGSSARAELVCIAELAEVCKGFDDPGLRVTVEEAGVTADRLVAVEAPDADAWLTLRPWAGMVADSRDREGKRAFGGGSSTLLARSPLVLVVWTDRGAVLDKRCKPTLTWRCVARYAGKPWGDVGGPPQWGQLHPGIADPTENATGLLVLGQAASDFLGTSSFNARDLERDAFFARMTALEAALPDDISTATKPLQQQLQFGPGRFDIVGTTEAEAGPLLARSAQRRGQLQMRYLEPVAVAEVVLAPLRPGRGSERVQNIVKDRGPAALAQAGWRVAGQQTAAGVPAQPALPSDANLPIPGVLEALRIRWEEIAR